MVDEPDPSETSQTNGEQKESKQNSHVAENIRKALKAVGRGILATVNWIDAKGAFITALTTIVIAVLTFFYVHYSRAQWQVMNEQRQAMTTANRINAQAAGAAASAATTAQQTLTQTTNAFQLDERPWVYVSSFGLVSEPEANKEGPKIDFSLMNSGKTPALNVVSFYETSSRPVTTDPPPSTFKTREPPRTDILPPNFAGNIIGTFPVNSITDPTRLAGYGLGTVAIYIQVKITYSDVFHNRYWTTVCAYHTHDVPRNYFTACRSGNDVGQEKP